MNYSLPYSAYFDYELERLNRIHIVNLELVVHQPNEVIALLNQIAYIFEIGLFEEHFFDQILKVKMDNYFEYFVDQNIKDILI